MCFSDAKSKDIAVQSVSVKRFGSAVRLSTIVSNLNAVTQVVSKKDIIKRVAEEWRALSNRERADWDEIARDDKLR